jgi:hypothetical protein
MKGLARLNLFLMLSAAALLAANWSVRRSHSPGLPQPDAGETLTPMWAGATKPAAPGQTAEKAADPTPASRRRSGAAKSPLAYSAPGVDWAKVESADYKKYVKNLRAMGFPEELIRSIAIADVDKLYEAREEPLKPKLVAYDAPLSQRQTHDISADDWQRIQDLWALRVEKQGALEEILDTYVPREILRTPISRNYEAYEYALTLLPPEKRDAVQLAQETEILSEGMNKTTITDHQQELESFKRTRQERDEAMLKVLTPQEFNLYEMNTTPAGTELARRTIGMQPTDDEFSTMFQIAYKNWVDTGGVYGRWRAMPVPGDQIAAADAQMNASLSLALGPDRFLDYQMAVNGTGQRMRNFAARFELPRDIMAQAFELQTQIDKLGRRGGPRLDGAVDGSTAPPSERAAQLQGSLQQVLGLRLWEAWEQGRNLQVNLDP